MKMNEKPDNPKNEPVISCEVCLKEIPPDSGEYLETDEYVQYFCGIECYNQWKQGADKENND